MITSDLSSDMYGPQVGEKQENLSSVIGAHIGEKP